MLELIIDDFYRIDLKDDFSITMNYLSPLFNDKGSSSFTANANLTANNKKAIKFSHRLNAREISRDFSYQLYFNKKNLDSGTFTISNLNNHSFEFYLKSMEGDFYSQIKEKKLNKIGMPSVLGWNTFSSYNTSLWNSIHYNYPDKDFTVFIHV